jgi:hypothetical protein
VEVAARDFESSRFRHLAGGNHFRERCRHCGLRRLHGQPVRGRDVHLSGIRERIGAERSSSSNTVSIPHERREFFKPDRLCAVRAKPTAVAFRIDPPEAELVQTLSWRLGLFWVGEEAVPGRGHRNIAHAIVPEEFVEEGGVDGVGAAEVKGFTFFPFLGVHPIN